MERFDFLDSAIVAMAAACGMPCNVLTWTDWERKALGLKPISVRLTSPDSNGLVERYAAAMGVSCAEMIWPVVESTELS